MAEIFVQCGNLIMVPNQLTRLGHDQGKYKENNIEFICFLFLESTDLLPSCVIQFWKPIIQIIVNDSSLISIIIDKILNFISDIYGLTSTDPSIIDQQRIGWIFYLIDQPSIKIDLCSIFLRLVRILQPWFAESLSQMVVRMADDSDATRQPFISEQKRDTLLRTISMFANPFEHVNENQTTTTTTTSSSLEILPRNELYKKEMSMFKKREIQR
jgi:hypothetical protein